MTTKRYIYKMANLKETAMAYEPTEFKNIADIKSINIDVDIKEKTAKNKEGEDFTYSYFVDAEGEEVRVPKTVLAQLKGLFEEKPDMKTFKVKKHGEGLGTKYQTITLE